MRDWEIWALRLQMGELGRDIGETQITASSHLNHTPAGSLENIFGCRPCSKKGEELNNLDIMPHKALAVLLIKYWGGFVTKLDLWNPVVLVADRVLSHGWWSHYELWSEAKPSVFFWYKYISSKQHLSYCMHKTWMVSAYWKNTKLFVQSTKLCTICKSLTFQWPSECILINALVFF